MSGIRQPLQRLIAALATPPPWFWLGSRRPWRRLGNRPGWRWPLEMLQQLHWWLIRPLLQSGRRPPEEAPLPPALAWRACWLNSYGPHEVRWWLALGIRRWRQLRCQVPDSLVGRLHAERRLSWPEQCRPAIATLADKAALLSLTPPDWQPPFLVLPNTDPPAPAPAWWQAALEGSGIVLKPRRGHAGRAVVRFRWRQNALQQQALFRRLGPESPTYDGQSQPDPDQLLEHWQHLCRSEEEALASPYLRHSPALPPASPAVVVRVITARNTPDSPVAVVLAWLEVPLSEGPVAFLHIDGQNLPQPFSPLGAAALQSLNAWQDLLRRGRPRCLEACLQAAVALHQRLPPIDRVAWDWVPADPCPLLLEGNSGFGLLIPQLFAQLLRASNRSDGQEATGLSDLWEHELPTD